MPMNIGLQKSILEKRVLRCGIDTQTIDYDALIDKEAGLNDNWKAIMEAIPETDRGKMANLPATIKEEKLVNEALEAEQLRSLVEKVEEAEKSAREAVRDGDKSVEIDRIYNVPINYVLMTGKGFSNCLVLSGKAGTGKTYQVIRTLETNKIEYDYSAGCKSPLALYKYQFTHKDDEVVVFDDVYGLINDERALSILMGATWSATGQRTISWDTTSGKLEDVPSKFEFNSRIIICLNDVESNELVRALVSRSLHYEVNLSYSEMIMVMYEIAKSKNKRITKEERLAIVDYIKEKTSDATIGLDLRTQQKIEQIYLYDKVKWKDLAENLINRKNTPMELVRDLIMRGKPVSEQIKEFGCWGYSRSTYFEYKKILVEKSESPIQMKI